MAIPLAALAAMAGYARGTSEKQAKLEEKLEKRIKEINDNEVELAKSNHVTKLKEYNERKKKYDTIRAAGTPFMRNVRYNMDILGIKDEKTAYAKAEAEPLDITDEWINSQVGDQPLANYLEQKTDLSGVSVPSVMSRMGAAVGITDQPESVEDQIKRLRLERIQAMPADTTTISSPEAYAGTIERPAWSKEVDKEKDMRGTLRKKYDDALSIAKERNMENPEEFAFNMVKADKENQDLRGTTRKKFDDLVGIKIESGIPETQARAEAMAEVLREEKDNRSAFQKKFDEKVEMYKSIRNLSEEEAKKLALADIEQENAINRDIVVPTIMAISRGEKVPASTMAAFQAYNASRQNFFTQALALGGEGLNQFVAKPGEQQPQPAPVPSPTAKTMPVEQALAILREKATPEMVQFFIDTYGEDKLPPEFKQQ